MDPLASQPRLAISAHFDGTSQDIVATSTQYELERLKDHVALRGGDVAASADVYRQPLEKLGVFASHFTPSGAIHSALQGMLREKAWTGYRRYDIRPDGAQVARQETSSALHGSYLKESLAANLRQYPNAFQLVYMFGHGSGQKSVAGVPAQELSGMQSDAIVLHSCYGNSLSTLRELTEQDAMPRVLIGAEVKISSDLKVREEKGHYETGLTQYLPQALGQLDKNMTPQQIADCLLGPLQDASTNHFAIDLEVVKKRLLPAMDKIGNLLRAQGGGSAEPAPTPAAAKSEKNQSRETRHVDLGQMLEVLSGEEMPTDVRQAAVEARQALRASILGTTGRSDEKLMTSGIYVET